MSICSVSIPALYNTCTDTSCSVLACHYNFPGQAAPMLFTSTKWMNTFITSYHLFFLNSL